MLACVCHRVPRDMRGRMRAFYTQALGMGLVEESGSQSPGDWDLFRYGSPDCPNSAGVQLNYADIPPAAQMYGFDANPAYWKIGIALADVNRSVEAMGKLPADIRPGALRPGTQFLDIGFLVHIQDPCSSTIELLQTTFEESTEAREKILLQLDAALASEGADPGATPTLGQRGKKCVGQLTIRSENIQASLAFYCNLLGMKLICVEPVTRHGFDLYFLAFTNEAPPNACDPKDVANREWCYQREYTTLEIRSPQGSSHQPSCPTPPDPGLSGMDLEGAVAEGRDQFCERQFLESHPVGFLGMVLETTPDGEGSEKLCRILDRAGKTKPGDSIVITDPDRVQVKILRRGVAANLPVA